MSAPNAYLGDGIIATFYGYDIALSVEREETHIIYLDYEGFKKLVKFAEKHWLKRIVP